MTVIEGGKMNFNLTTPTQLLPFLKGQNHAEKLMQKYLRSSHFEQERILRKAPELQMSPILDEFLFPKSKTHSTKDLDLYSGTGLAKKTVINSWGELKDEEVKFSLIKAVDKKGRFEFIVQPEETFCHLVVCKVIPNFRGKGLFGDMVGAIADYCFNELQFRSVSGSARPPSTEPDMDWRCEKTQYRTNFKSGEEVILTKLHQLWLSQPYAVHSRVLGIEDEDGFALLSPEYLTALPIDEIANLDKYHPKKEENSFVYLMDQKGAVA
jgi:hypothetical protein